MLKQGRRGGVGDRAHLQGEGIVDVAKKPLNGNGSGPKTPRASQELPSILDISKTWATAREQQDQERLRQLRQMRREDAPRRIIARSKRWKVRPGVLWNFDLALRIGALAKLAKSMGKTIDLPHGMIAAHAQAMLRQASIGRVGWRRRIANRLKTLYDAAIDAGLLNIPVEDPRAWESPTIPQRDSMTYFRDNRSPNLFEDIESALDVRPVGVDASAIAGAGVATRGNLVDGQTAEPPRASSSTSAKSKKGSGPVRDNGAGGAGIVSELKSIQREAKKAGEDVRRLFQSCSSSSEQKDDARLIELATAIARFDEAMSRRVLTMIDARRETGDRIPLKDHSSPRDESWSDVDVDIAEALRTMVSDRFHISIPGSIDSDDAFPGRDTEHDRFYFSDLLRGDGDHTYARRRHRKRELFEAAQRIRQLTHVQHERCDEESGHQQENQADPMSSEKLLSILQGLEREFDDIARAFLAPSRTDDALFGYLRDAADRAGKIVVDLVSQNRLLIPSLPNSWMSLCRVGNSDLSLRWWSLNGKGGGNLSDGSLQDVALRVCTFLATMEEPRSIGSRPAVASAFLQRHVFFEFATRSLAMFDRDAATTIELPKLRFRRADDFEFDLVSDALIGDEATKLMSRAREISLACRDACAYVGKVLESKVSTGSLKSRRAAPMEPGVPEGWQTLRSACKTFGVPHSTLHRWVSGLRAGSERKKHPSKNCIIVLATAVEKLVKAKGRAAPVDSLMD